MPIDIDMEEGEAPEITPEQLDLLMRKTVEFAAGKYKSPERSMALQVDLLDELHASSIYIAGALLRIERHLGTLPETFPKEL